MDYVYVEMDILNWFFKMLKEFVKLVQNNVKHANKAPLNVLLVIKL